MTKEKKVLFDVSDKFRIIYEAGYAVLYSMDITRFKDMTAEEIIIILKEEEK